MSLSISRLNAFESAIRSEMECRLKETESQKKINKKAKDGKVEMETMLEHERLKNATLRQYIEVLEIKMVMSVAILSK